MNYLKHLALMCYIITSQTLPAIEVTSEFDISNIYRHDQYARHSKLALIPPTISAVDHTSMKNIDIYQFGLKGRLRPPTDHYYWSHNTLLSYLDNLYLDGFAYWGWGGKGGKYHEKLDNLTNKTKSTASGKLKKVLTWDLQMGVGYLFNWDCWGVGVSGGYAYNTQKAKPKNLKISVALPTTLIDNQINASSYHTKTLWKGPWIGLELFYNWSDWRFELGYEYHKALYTANHYISPAAAQTANIPLTAQPLIYEDKTHAHNAWGNVAFVEALYHFCDGWKAGLNFKYQSWQAKNGKLKPDDTTFALKGLPRTTRVKAGGSWISYSAELELGYYF